MSFINVLANNEIVADLEVQNKLIVKNQILTKQLVLTENITLADNVTIVGDLVGKITNIIGVDETGSDITEEMTIIDKLSRINTRIQNNLHTL